MVRTRDAWLGPAARPVAIPDDIDDPLLPKASGVVVLPPHVRWSEPTLAYDLERLPDRLRVSNRYFGKAPRTTSASALT
jgi:hypothetical protein